MKLRNLTPDFFIKNITTDESVLVGDAKNSEGGVDHKHLIENYMNQSDAKFGLIISRNPEMKQRESNEYAWNIIII